MSTILLLYILYHPGLMVPWKWIIPLCAFDSCNLIYLIVRILVWFFKEVSSEETSVDEDTIPKSKEFIPLSNDTENVHIQTVREIQPVQDIQTVKEI